MNMRPIKRSHRITASLLALLTLWSICEPTVAYALTGGPSQPEFDSFEPVGTDQMVDLFTGDFNYNIPLLTVPGPNGGYPINLAYHSGVTMEQEASWVGLGWNINAGAITRQLRGLPDDFNGDEVTKTVNMRPQETWSLSYAPGPSKTEILGGEISYQANFQFYHNSYKGVGYRMGLNPYQPVSSQFSGQYEYSVGAGVNFDSRSGLGFDASISFPWKINRRQHNLSAGIGVHSRNGVYRSSLGYSLSTRFSKRLQGRSESTADEETRDVAEVASTKPAGVGVDFASSSYVPGNFARTTGFDLPVTVGFGDVAGAAFTNNFTLGGSYSISKIKHVEREVSAYGYLYSEGRGTDEHGMMDLNRDKDIPVTRRAESAPMPVCTYDPYIISGQGTGGMYRGYRGDVGLLQDESVTSSSDGIQINSEIGATGTNFHVGVDLGYVDNNSYSGGWRDGIDQITTSGTAVDLQFRGRHSGQLYEPFCFRTAGERTAEPLNTWSGTLGEQAARFKLGLALDLDLFSDGGDGFLGVPKVQRYLASSGAFQQVPSGAGEREDRQIRVQNIEYRTMEEIHSRPGFTDRPCHLFAMNQFPEGQDCGTEAEQISYPVSGKRKHHIGEVSVLEPTGMRYTYGLPVSNLEHKEVAFSVEGTSGNPPRIDGYGATSDLVNNENGLDHFYSATELPPYVHAHLLTQVTSPDYVDLLNDGPTEDDLGYYVKFNYTTTSSIGVTPSGFKWRVPYRGANYVKGDYSNPDDDKATYQYGKREVYYMHSIETKTHIALFYLSLDREDGRGAVDEDNTTGFGAHQPQLDSLRLYSKADLDVPLKTVVFQYSEELCYGVENNEEGFGKLTLWRVYFKYLNNDKGESSPYSFQYNVSGYGDDQNPPYNYMDMDRWGAYKPAPSGTAYVNHEYPYVDQMVGAPNRDNRASAWCLRRINLPSGGSIHVRYEADDYAYVQDKRAMQMFRIKGTSQTDCASLNYDCVDDNGRIKKNDLRIYFELEQPWWDYIDYWGGFGAHGSVPDPYAPLTDDAEEKFAEHLVRGVSDMYFKTWQRLKPGVDDVGEVWDYVEGYAKVSQEDGSYGVDLYDDQGLTGYVTLEQVQYNPVGTQCHPFRKAGWQYMRYQRDDLVNPSAGAGNPFVALFSMAMSSFDLFFGFYNMANSKGWCQRISVETEDKPSYIRLNSPDGIKYGGGHRVSSLAVLDDWEEKSNGKVYEYRMQDPDEPLRTISSGVAEYEPLVGGQEIPQHLPIWYNDNDQRISFRHEDAYLERPFGEALFPSGSVGYSRVVVRDMPAPYDEVSQNLSGITVHEFYTAKDFPIRTSQTQMDHKGLELQLFIPLVGTYNTNHHGYSQGYAVELNDMHGKLKAVSTYPTCAQPTGQPKTRTTYHYSTDPDDAHRLNNKVEVLYDHWNKQAAYLGQTQEFYVDLRENSTRTNVYSGEFNVTNIAAFPIFSFWPGWDHTSGMFRSVVTTKVINKLGILKKVVYEEDGARVVTDNLLFDAYTGEPLLTSVTNMFDDPVYTYKYAAHFTYPGMEGAYQNWGTEFKEVDITDGVFDITDAAGFFHPGDEVEVDDGSATVSVYWVMSVGTDDIQLANADGSTADIDHTNVRMVIRRSGHRNMQAVQQGTIVSLRDIVDLAHTEALFIGFNEDLESSDDLSGTFEYGCQGEYFVTAAIENEEATYAAVSSCPSALRFRATVCGPVDPAYVAFLFFDQEIGGVSGIEDYTIEGYTGEVITLCGVTGPEVLVSDNLGNTYSTVFYIDPEDYATVDPDACFNKCWRVLHADMTEYADAWSYDYVDAGKPAVEPAGTTVALQNDPLNFNPYRYGQSGVWRPIRNHLYQVDRLNDVDQSVTNIRRDGEYKEFTFFDFETPANNQPRWVEREKITQYNAYGFPVESKDALDVTSSELYGYSTSVVTAAAANADYYEIAYDGFEDHGTQLSPAGHLKFYKNSSTSTAADVVDDAGHTGKGSLQLTGSDVLYSPVVIGGGIDGVLGMYANRKQVVSAWFRTDDRALEPEIKVYSSAGTLLTTQTLINDQPIIEGWQKVDVEFESPALGPFTIRFSVPGAVDPWYVDDVRVHPYASSITTFVYDPLQLWLVARLDDRNYATFFNYDEEGTLVQEKQETERGVVTLRTSRKHIAQTP